MKPSHPLRVPVLLSGNVMVVLLVAALNPALPAIERHFAGEPGAGFLVRLALTTPALFVALGSIPASILCDKVGRKAVLIASIAGYALSGLCCALSPSVAILLAGRAFQGLFAAGVLTACTTLVGDYFQAERRARVIGLQGAVISGSSMLVLLLSGVLATLDWRAPFFLYVAMVLVIPFAVIALVEPAARDQTGAPQFSATVGRLWRLLAFGVFSSILFFMPAVNAPFLLAKSGVSDPRLIGLALAVMTGSGIVTALLYARLRGAVGSWRVFTAAMGAAGLGMAGLAFAPNFALSLMSLVLVGAGMGLMTPGLTTLAFERTQEAERAGAAGGIMGAIFLGEFLSPLASEAVTQVLGLNGLFLAFAAMAGVTAVAALIPSRSNLVANA